jgi:L-fuconolactonase
VIDSHQHFWRLERGDYGWLTPALAPIHRDFGPGDLAPILTRHGIAHTILVQAAPTLDETAFLLAIAQRTPFVAGVVGWADFDTPAAPATIATLSSDRLLVGLRPMVQDLADDDWLARPSLAPAFEAMIAHDLVFDALVRPHHLPRLSAVLERHPALAVVIDHGAKPDIRGRGIVAWRHAMAAIAAFPRVSCKLSGLVTEAPPEAGASAIRPYIDTLVDLFGPHRLLWGSDWPVVELAGGYDRWRALALDAIAPLSAADRAQVLGGNAARVYLSRRGRRVRSDGPSPPRTDRASPA